MNLYLIISDYDNDFVSANLVNDGMFSVWRRDGEIDIVSEAVVDFVGDNDVVLAGEMNDFLYVDDNMPDVGDMVIGVMVLANMSQTLLSTKRSSVSPPSIMRRTIELIKSMESH